MRGYWRRETALYRSHAAFLILAGGLIAVASTNLIAQQPVTNDWIGKFVVQRDSRLYLATTGKGFNPARVSIYRVTQVNGTRLQLTDGRIYGWTQAERVIPVEEAIDFFTEQIRTHRNAHNFVARGKVLASKGELDRALADFNEVIRLTPTDPWIYAHRGIVWNGKHEYDKAIADFGEAIRLNPKNAEACLGRGDAWLQKADFDKAIADYDQAVKLLPQDPTSRCARPAPCSTRVNSTRPSPISPR